MGAPAADAGQLGLCFGMKSGATLAPPLRRRTRVLIRLTRATSKHSGVVTFASNHSAAPFACSRCVVSLTIRLSLVWP